MGSYRMEITDILASGEHSSGTGPAVASPSSPAAPAGRDGRREGRGGRARRGPETRAHDTTANNRQGSRGDPTNKGSAETAGRDDVPTVGQRPRERAVRCDKLPLPPPHPAIINRVQCPFLSLPSALGARPHIGTNRTGHGKAPGRRRGRGRACNDPTRPTSGEPISRRRAGRRAVEIDRRWLGAPPPPPACVGHRGVASPLGRQWSVSGPLRWRR